MKTIRIGEYDVPEPLREAPEIGTTYYVINIYSGGADVCVWGSYMEFELEALRRGFLHATREAAELHAKALHAKAIISLTKAKDAQPRA